MGTNSTAIVWVFVLVLAPSVLVLVEGLLRGRIAPMAGLVGVLLLPFVAYLVGNLILMEHAKHVDFCVSCHEMAPIVHGMKSPGSSLASIHYASHFPKEDACYVCHTSYGIWGDADAKWAGVKHMAVSLTGTAKYPLEIYGSFAYESCLSCHPGAREGGARPHDDPAVVRTLADASVGCTGSCHPRAHPETAIQAPAGPQRLGRSWR